MASDQKNGVYLRKHVGGWGSSRERQRLSAAQAVAGIAVPPNPGVKKLTISLGTQSGSHLDYRAEYVPNP